MKMLTFLMQAKHTLDVQPTGQYSENALFSELPGFLRDQFLPSLLSTKIACQDKSKSMERGTCFKIILENNDFQLIHNNKKISLSLKQSISLDNILLEITSDDTEVAQDFAESSILIPKSEIQETIKSIQQDKYHRKDIIYMPRITNDCAPLNEHFCAPPMRDQNFSTLGSIQKYEDKNTANGDILRDLGFAETNETDLRRTIKSLDYTLEKNVVAGSKSNEIHGLMKFW